MGIATSLALTMFEGEELNQAMGVPFLYGVAEIVFISIFCIGAWKSGWTKAPANESICKVICTSYEVETSEGLLESEILPSTPSSPPQRKDTDGASTMAASASTELTAVEPTEVISSE